MNLAKWPLVSCFGITLLLLAAGCPTKTSKDTNEPRLSSSGSAACSVNRQTSAEASGATDNRPTITPYGYKLIREYPHDPCCFTQGLFYENGFLYEGTGLYGQSRLIKHNFVRSNSYSPLPVIKQIQLAKQFFGEGITLVGDRLIQLTWQEHTGFVYDKNTFSRIGQFDIATEGWGLTYDGRRLILSDGSSDLYFLDPNTFSQIGRLHVTERGFPIRYINELEYINDPAFIRSLKLEVSSEKSDDFKLQTSNFKLEGVVLANILGENYLVIISPQTGNVTGRIDLTGIYTPPPTDDNNHVLNGIAYLQDSQHLLVTGKCWTKMFEIEIK